MNVFRLRRLRRARRLQRRGVFLLPSLFTVGNIFCGFLAIIKASHGDFRVASILILAAGVFDGLDGRIARMTGSTSEFGLQLDSIADTISFGVAPAFMMYAWGEMPITRYGWLFSFLYVICASARLARFNIQHTVRDNRYFIGLPTPPAAALVVSTILCFPGPVKDSRMAAAAGLFLAVVSILMISTIRFRSFKDIDMRSRRSYLAIIAIAAILIGITIDPPKVILGLSVLYVLTGLFGSLFPRRGRGPAPFAADAPVSPRDQTPDEPHETDRHQA